MSTPHSALARDLLQAARGDRPDAARRSRIWEAVASAPEVSIAAAGTGAALAGASASAGKTFGALSATKLLLLGALAGSLATTGVGAWVVRSMMHSETGRPILSVMRSDAPSVAPSVVTAVVSAPAVIAPTTEPVAAEAVAAEAAPIRAKTPVQSATAGAGMAHVASTLVSPTPVSTEASLMREAALLSEARTLVVSGQASSALELLDAAAKGSSHSLEPETLSLRSRALRALGRDAEADQVEETLRHRYPDHFLAR